jgi:hypothetical protein
MFEVKYGRLPVDAVPNRPVQPLVNAVGVQQHPVLASKASSSESSSDDDEAEELKHQQQLKILQLQVSKTCKKCIGTCMQGCAVQFRIILLATVNMVSDVFVMSGRRG